MNKITFTVAIIIIGLIFLASPYKTKAITIIPPRIELAGDPGQNISNFFKIFNETEKTLILYVSTANFTAKQGKEGVPQFLSPEENIYDLASWIQTEEGPITVLPSEYKTVNYSINIPFDADPGGHYAGIFLGNKNPNGEGGNNDSVGISSKAGMLVLLGVSGAVNESAGLEDFALKNKKVFFESLPVDFSVGFRNNGNVHLRPEGAISIKNIFGKEVASIDVNRRKIGAGANVLPDTVRHFDASWEKISALPDSGGEGFLDKLKKEQDNFALGKYIANLELSYGSKKNIVRAELAFWVFPWRLILAYLLAGIILFSSFIFLIKRYNRWIISQAEKK